MAHEAAEGSFVSVPEFLCVAPPSWRKRISAQPFGYFQPAQALAA